MMARLDVPVSPYFAGPKPQGLGTKTRISPDDHLWMWSWYTYFDSNFTSTKTTLRPKSEEAGRQRTAPPVNLARPRSLWAKTSAVTGVESVVVGVLAPS